jgi:FlaA1/EpsC-like NDP-sugar epimerase
MAARDHATSHWMKTGGHDMRSRKKPNARRIFDGKRILITGGTGSLGQTLLRRLLEGSAGRPTKIVVFSRDEEKQHHLRIKYRDAKTLAFWIGDIRNYGAVCAALANIDIVFNAAALKQVPTCEYCPQEAILTNLAGPENIIRAIRDLRLPVETVVGISTDKAVKPVNVMGMTKALQERLFATASLHAHDTRFVVVRYGNVLVSRGSVVPLFNDQIRNGGPLTITHPEMTRFMLGLDEAVDTIFAAVRDARNGETYVPRIRSARVADVATALIDRRPIKTKVTGIRPGEKLHEVLVSEEECRRTLTRGRYYVIKSILPELGGEDGDEPSLEREFSSAEHLMTLDEVRKMMAEADLIVPTAR